MRILFVLFIMGMLATSCGKDESCPQTMANIAGTYRYTSILVKSPTFSSDYFMPCQNDDSVIMRKDGSYEIKDMNTICTPVSTNYTGTWSVVGNKILVDGIDYNIQFFDCNRIIFSRENSPSAGSTITFQARKLQ